MTLKRRWSGNDRTARRGVPAGLPVRRVASAPVDVHAIREHFAFPRLGRIVTNNAASTQPPGELLALYQSLAPGYENVHRGQSSASQAMTALFEESYDTIARFIGVARALNQAGIESRAGCHCATLAHHALGLDPPASCRLSFYLYNTPGEIDRAVDAVAAIAAGRPAPVPVVPA
jgi:selenocysteine lyase/cysteine desulfurase